MASKWTCL